jgi:hypothetical protein
VQAQALVFALSSGLVISVLSGPELLANEPILHDRITVNWAERLSTFRPADAFGIAIDGGTPDEVKRLFLSANRRPLASLAERLVSYRLRTELGIEAWHWRSRGSWSDPHHQRGYWTGDADAPGDDPISYGYRLPRRGNTHDEANDDGYSRIDDGDPRSFWKSDPHLDQHYTGVAGQHRDWVVVELPKVTGIDAIDIYWAIPFARRFEVQYWVGEDEYSGRWARFPAGQVNDGHGGEQVSRLAPTPVATRFVRVLMTESSRTAPPGSTDVRDRLGFAVAEIGLGHVGSAGRFVDIIRHSVVHGRQTIIHVSSTDPWHRAIDRDVDTAQPSVTSLEGAGVISRRPLMMPVGVLYDTPENMLAMLDYLRRRDIAVDKVELGEEPDGQLVSAEDYGALYVEFADAIRKRQPTLKLGGPSLVNGISDTWLDASPDESWTRHFIRYLQARQALDRLSFFSYEYFPFDDVCGSPSIKLRDQTLQIRDLYKRLGDDGVPNTIPWYITEIGYSAFGGAPLVQMPSALVTADIYGDVLRRGGAAVFAYGLTPDDLIKGQARCAGQGNLMFWAADGRGRAAYPMPSLRALNLLSNDWAAEASHQELYRSTSAFKDARGRTMVSSYALRDNNRRWSVLLVNRSTQPIEEALGFEHQGGPSKFVSVTRYSGEHYRWDNPKPGGHPARDVKPATQIDRSWNGKLRLAPMSLTVVTGRWDGPRAPR